MKNVNSQKRFGFGDEKNQCMMAVIHRNDEGYHGMGKPDREMIRQSETELVKTKDRKIYFRLMSFILFFFFISKMNGQFCGFDECYAGLNINNPSQEAIFEQNNQLLQNAIKLRNSSNLQFTDKLIVPVVFHVIYLNEPVGDGTNIPSSKINECLDDLNAKFNNANQLGINTNIEFCLAVRDPQGNPTTGINRVSGLGIANYENVGITTSGNEYAIKNLSRWPNQDYYNIWIVSEINGNNGGAGVQGFAYFPGSPEYFDGTVIMSNLVGSGSNNNVLVHEIGHALNLFHTFNGDCPSGNENLCNQGIGLECPSNLNPTTEGDQCSDTEPHKRIVGGCDPLGQNQCMSPLSSNQNFIYNYLSYSENSCLTKFSAA
jgi:Pregnancy-associated plasma protein-A